MPPADRISIVNASENNLRNISLELPKNKLILVTGVSGSGKSSLVFDVIYREAESRFLGSYSTHARQFLGKLRRPSVERIDGLSPAIALDQRAVQANVRSTVGTLTGIYDHLRLLYARLGDPPAGNPDIKLSRSLFSFNSPEGACPACNGLGVEDFLDPELLVADASKSLRDRALVITAPNGYIIYSQVTLEVLDQVCRAEGFTIDIPWRELTPEQKKIVLYGSDKIEIPFGKHPLESRMKWSGITAKPRETGTYKGIIPTMEAILKRDRNKNILRFVRTVGCSACRGTRLNERALSVRIGGRNIADLAAAPLDELSGLLKGLPFTGSAAEAAAAILSPVYERIRLFSELGLGYLTCSRESGSLSRGEGQRLRLAIHAGSDLTDVLYLFDEPSVGLHPADTERLTGVLKTLRDRGNTVIVVEHDEDFIARCDWLTDLGPGAGLNGGCVLVNCETSALDTLPDETIRASRTLSFHKGHERFTVPAVRRKGTGTILFTGARANNLRDIRAEFLAGALNVVTGVSGAGKSSLVMRVLGDHLRHRLNADIPPPETYDTAEGTELIRKVIPIDQSPIGRTPRSNPATYTGLMDLIRDLFASLPEVKEKGWEKGRFSFNTAGGRCESCEGAGYQQIGMHFLGNVDIPCEECRGRRFNEETLSVKYRGKDVSDILELHIDDAASFFRDHPKILHILSLLQTLGLGYLTLGQRSGTLSGGEAQRIKLATELSRPGSAHTLYILDEPTTGLHNADVVNLMTALQGLVEQGNTVVLVEHHPGIILAADRVIDLGPGSGLKGGTIVVSGTPEEVMACSGSLTGQALAGHFSQKPAEPSAAANLPPVVDTIRFTGISTNNLKGIDVAFPKRKLTVITGVSGSGKSSLAFDTLHAEGQTRYLENYSPYICSQIGMMEQGDFETVSGITPTLAVDQHVSGRNLRSTVGTLSGIHDHYRLLFSRVGRSDTGPTPVLSSLFSFNHHHGACPVCDGLGSVVSCDPEKLITHPGRSVLDGAMDGTKTGRFYGDPNGQYVATMKAVAAVLGLDLAIPWAELGDDARKAVMHGTGDRTYSVTWEYRRDERTGEHHFEGRWAGLIALVNEEYGRKHADRRGEEMKPVLSEKTCTACEGARLNPEALSYRIGGLTIHEVSVLTISESLDFFLNEISRTLPATDLHAMKGLLEQITRRLGTLAELGLSYLTSDRLTATLSGGESHRIRLAGQLGSGLTGVTYVLDEPTVGLHPADTEPLLRKLRELILQGNTVVAVEHDTALIRAADLVLDLGPGAGSEGGRLISSGTPAMLMNDPRSVTGKFLSGAEQVPVSKNRPLLPGIVIRNATVHNLQNLDTEIPSGGIVAVTGVSGSGKSSLVFDVIHASWIAGKPVCCDRIDGLEQFSNTMALLPHTRHTGSAGTVATFTGLLDLLRTLFAATDDAKALGLTRNHFSYMTAAGRCQDCQGSGEVRYHLDFLPDIRIPCETCGGTRFAPAVANCRWNGKSLPEVMEMTFHEAASLFDSTPKIHELIESVRSIGMGYLKPGQPLNTLSGGEAQRLSLVTELLGKKRGKTLFLLEEPSTGLHFRDLRYLAHLFQELASQGHTLILIEHDPLLIGCADHVIDMGPGTGKEGGRVVASCRVTELSNFDLSATGKFLKKYL